MSPSKKGPKTRLTWLPSSSISRGFAGGTKEFPLDEENNVLLELTKYFQNYFRVKCWSLPKIHSTPKTPSEYLMKSLKRFRKHSSNGMLHLVFTAITALKKILLTCRCLGPLPGVCGWSTLRGSYWIWEETRLTINFLWPTERPAPIIVIFSAWYPGVSDNNVLEINSWQTAPESEDNPQYYASCCCFTVILCFLPGALDLVDLAFLPEGDAAGDGGVAPVRANWGRGLPSVVTGIKRKKLNIEIFLV